LVDKNRPDPAGSGAREQDAHAPKKKRSGLPDPASVVSVKRFVSPGGRRYRILRTDEDDAYDKAPKGAPKRR
jgi:hypothetical protein